MGLFDTLARGVAAGFDGDADASTEGGPSGYRTRKMALVEEARRQTRDDVLKQEVERKVQLADDVATKLEGTDAVMKHYDPALLKDLASNPVTMAYIDTMAQDAASANWAVKPRNEKASPDDSLLADTEERIKNLHPEETFRDVREELARGVLETGDAPYVKSFVDGDPEGELVEATPVDSTTFYKTIDDHAFTTGYLQVLSEREEPIEFDENEVAWVSWSPGPGKVYGDSPVFKSQDTIEVLEEIQEKEILDLVQGMPPGIVSRPAETDLPIDASDWQNFKTDMRLNEGERHRFGFAKFPVDYQPLTPNYQELQLIDRYKAKVTELGGVFKVNPSYAGFDFENVNRATDASQRESYKQRGFRVLVRLLESALNRGIIWPHISEDIKFEFEREQSTEERESRANYLREAATAGKELADAGLDVKWRDGDLKIEDGDMSAGSIGDSGGGGIFGTVPDEGENGQTGLPSPDGPEAPGGDAETGPVAEADGGVPAEKEDGGSGNSTPGSGSTNTTPTTDEGRRLLTKSQAEDVDAILFDAFEKQIMPEDAPGIEKKIWTSDTQIPQYVRDKITEAIDDGAVFRHFEDISGRARRQVEGAIEDALTDSDGWNLQGVVDTFRDAFPGLTEEKAEVVVRTETASVLNNARELGYEDRDAHGDRGEARLMFKWVGPDDTRTTPACERLKELTNPDYSDSAGRSGTPVDLSALKRLERRVHTEFFPQLEFRDHTIHPNERHTFRRVLPFEVDKSSTPPDPETVEISVAVGDAAHGTTPAEYRRIVEKITAHTQDRSSREAEIEHALDASIPGLLREVLEESNGAKTTALRDLNHRLDDVGKDRDVSEPTFYNWIDKYSLG